MSGGVVQGLKVGFFTKDNFTGDFVDGWKQTLKDANLEMVRINFVIIQFISIII